MLISALCGTLLPGRDEPLKGAGQRAESQEEAGMAVYKGRGAVLQKLYVVVCRHVSIQETFLLWEHPHISLSTFCPFSLLSVLLVISQSGLHWNHCFYCSPRLV
ncbi:unnamed protein product [Natator depressus]